MVVWSLPDHSPGLTTNCVAVAVLGLREAGPGEQEGPAAAAAASALLLSSAPPHRPPHRHD